MLSGKIERVGQPGTVLSAKGLGQTVKDQPIAAGDHAGAADQLIALLRDRLGDRIISAIGHRVVHGGLDLVDHQMIDAKVLDQLRAATQLDSSHLPREIKLIEAFTKQFPGIPQIACFDTAFCKNLPMVAKILPIPRKYFDEGIHRFGFHGISYAYLMKELRRLDSNAADGKVILAHLGSGASMAAVKDGRPIDTTMSFTPIAGLVMGTRPGDLDPGFVSYLMRSEKLSADQLDDFLNKKCGLLGVSGTSADMRDLTEHRNTDAHAAEAVALFCYEVKKRIGAYAAAMGGVDTIIFAGGIGEHSPQARFDICSDLAFLGIEVEPKLNDENQAVISTGRVAVRVIPTNEEIMIAHIVLGFTRKP